jgi:hypothetical protein
MDLDAQVRAYVDRARSQGDPAAWLRALRDRAMDAVNKGDVEITMSSFEGGSASGARKFNAQQLLETAQLALEEIEGNGEIFSVFPDRSRQVIVL